MSASGNTWQHEQAVQTTNTIIIDDISIACSSRNRMLLMQCGNQVPYCHE